MTWTGQRIWVFAVLLNGLFFGIEAAFYEWTDFFPIASLGTAIFGSIITAPLLFLIIPLVKLGKRIPCRVNVRIVCLAIMLVLTGFLFLMGLGALFTSEFPIDFINSLMVTALPSILIAVFLKRRALARLYTNE